MTVYHGNKICRKDRGWQHTYSETNTSFYFTDLSCNNLTYAQLYVLYLFPIFSTYRNWLIDISSTDLLVVTFSSQIEVDTVTGTLFYDGFVKGP